MDLIINDESITNDRGWRLSNQGCDLTRYAANPIVLYQHDTERIVGKASNLRIEGSKLIASVEFDTDDPLAKEVQRKAEKGFLRGVSPGFFISEMTYHEDYDSVTAWELLEISIVSIPSNRGAVKLYSREGVPLEREEEVKYLEQLKATMPKPNPTPAQESIQLASEAYQALALDASASAAELSQAILTLSAEFAKLKGELSDLRTDERNALITAAVQDGRIKEADRATYEQLYAKDETLCKSVLSSISKPQSLGSMLQSTPPAETRFAGSWDELDKRGELAALRAEDPELFRKKYEERFIKH